MDTKSTTVWLGSVGQCVWALKVSFKMGRFSDTQHTHPGNFILELPPPPPGLKTSNVSTFELCMLITIIGIANLMGFSNQKASGHGDLLSITLNR